MSYTIFGRKSYVYYEKKIPTVRTFKTNMDKNHVGVVDHIEEMIGGPTNSVVTVFVFVNGDYRRISWRVPIFR